MKAATRFIACALPLLLMLPGLPAAEPEKPAAVNHLLMDDSLKLAIPMDPKATMEQTEEGGLRIKYTVPEDFNPKTSTVGDLQKTFAKPLEAGMLIVEMPTHERGVLLQVWNEDGHHAHSQMQPRIIWELDLDSLTIKHTGEGFQGKIARCRITFPIETDPGEYVTEISRLELEP